ncbi:MAG: DUF805 domain-containing protein [Caulobacter sp.]|nr:DUF805 domain-containing protein [Caulobacter sp.]
MDWTKLFFSPDGRIGRQAYWIGWLVLIGVNTLLFWVPFLSLVTIYCWICVCSKRFHDMGRSGWLSAIPVTLSIVMPIGAVLAIAGAAVAASISGAGDETVIAAVLSAVAGSALLLLGALVIGIGFLIWQGVALGEPDANRYGPPPAPAF